MKNVLVCSLVFLMSGFTCVHASLYIDDSIYEDDSKNIYILRDIKNSKKAMQDAKRMIHKEIAKSTSVKDTIELTNMLISVYEAEKKDPLNRKKKDLQKLLFNCHK
jgi:hypothetical protein